MASTYLTDLDLEFVVNKTFVLIVANSLHRMNVSVCVTKRVIIQCHLFLPPLKATQPLPFFSAIFFFPPIAMQHLSPMDMDEDNDNEDNEDNKHN